MRTFISSFVLQKDYAKDQAFRGEVNCRTFAWVVGSAKVVIMVVEENPCTYHYYIKAFFSRPGWRWCSNGWASYDFFMQMPDNNMSKTDFKSSTNNGLIRYKPLAQPTMYIVYIYWRLFYSFQSHHLPLQLLARPKHLLHRI